MKRDPKPTGRMCIQRVAVGERECSNPRYCWIRCSHLQYTPNVYTCLVSRAFKTFKELPDGQLIASSCPMNEGGC